MRRGWLTLGIALAFAGSARPQEAPPRLDLLVCAPGFPGTPAQAQSVMDALAAAVAVGAGWAPDRVRARYVAAETEGVEALRAARPALLLATLPFYTRHAALIGGTLVAGSLLEGRPTQTFRVVVPPGTAAPAAGVAFLAGKRLTGTRLEDPTFLSRVVFAGALDVARQCTLVPGKRTLRALKLAAGTEADALLCSDAEWRLLQTPALADRTAGWQTVFVSKPLPTAPIVALGAAPADAPDPQLVQVVQRALVGLSATDTGPALCERLRVSGFGRPDAAAYRAAVKLYHPSTEDDDPKRGE